MKFEQFIEEFKQFSASAIKNNKPVADASLKPGTISYLQSYITVFSDKLKALNDVLVMEGNRLLETAESVPGLDLQKLKEEIFELGKDAMKQYTSQYKP